MAGERLRFDGFVEIGAVCAVCAVCADDNYRGRGLAAGLMNILRADNATAIGLYRRQGFEDRRTFGLYRVTRVRT